LPTIANVDDFSDLACWLIVQIGPISLNVTTPSREPNARQQGSFGLALSGALIENDQEHRPSKGEAHGDNQTEVQDEADQGEAEG
jgi:hypothetical protein